MYLCKYCSLFRLEFLFVFVSMSQHSVKQIMQNSTLTVPRIEYIMYCMTIRSMKILLYIIIRVSKYKIKRIL
jgi:hypothetical protein